MTYTNKPQHAKGRPVNRGKQRRINKLKRRSAYLADLQADLNSNTKKSDMVSMHMSNGMFSRSLQAYFQGQRQLNDTSAIQPVLEGNSANVVEAYRLKRAKWIRDRKGKAFIYWRDKRMRERHAKAVRQSYANRLKELNA